MMEKIKANKILIDFEQKEVLHKELPIHPFTSNAYLSAATSSNTRKAYRSDIKHYERWGGVLPASSDKVIQYLQTFASVLNARTLARRLTALKHWHQYQGFPDPTSHPTIAKTMKGIMRVHGKPKEKAPALSPEDLQKMVQMLLMDPSSLVASRDNAVLQIGFFGALRRSEIIHIRCEHIDWLKEGIEILLPSSKTDQTHEGQYCAIPYGNHVLCPIKALENWLEKAKIKEGVVFRRIMQNKIINDTPLTALSINHIIHRWATRAMLPYANDISPHSLRRGLATSAARANASIQTIMRAGRWKQVNTVMEYIEASLRFSDSAATSVILNMQNQDDK